MSDEACKSSVDLIVKKILSKQTLPDGQKVWRKEQHLALIVSCALEAGMDKESVPDFMALMNHDGIGGNASQFMKTERFNNVLAPSEKHAKAEKLKAALAMLDY